MIITVKNKNKIKKTTPEEEKVCWECGGVAEELTKYTPEGFSYNYWRCAKCGDEVLSMRQLEVMAKKQRELRRAKEATVSKWGTALAIRIPKEVVVAQRIQTGEKFLIMPEKIGFRAIPSASHRGRTKIIHQQR